MLLVSCGVGWNWSLCYWSCPSAELCCVSRVWIKCPFLVPPSMVMFNFRPITASPCANTPAAANAYLCLSVFLSLSCHTLSRSSISIMWESGAFEHNFVLTLITRSQYWFSVYEVHKPSCEERAKHSGASLYCFLFFFSSITNKADQHLHCLLTQSGCMWSAVLPQPGIR